MTISISFEQDAQLVGDLLALLSREQTHLIMMDVSAIEGLLEEKSDLLQRINVAAKRRYEMLAANGFESNELGMSDWVQSQVKPTLNKTWTDFQKLLSNAKEMNRLNGMLISKNFNRNQQLLNHLQGTSSAGSVYGRDGQAKSQLLTRPTLTA